MTDFLLLALGSLLISSAIAYAWWSKVRITFLREKLFEIRDDLWRVALRENGFSDPAYQKARDHLNGSIYLAYMWSIPVIGAIDKAANGVPVSQKPESSNPALQSAIQKAYEETADCITNYMFFWRASGWLCLFRMVFASLAQSSFRTMQMQWRSIRNWLTSDTPEELRQVDELSHKPFA